jgi:hypothetical protein
MWWCKKATQQEDNMGERSTATALNCQGIDQE